MKPLTAYFIDGAMKVFDPTLFTDNSVLAGEGNIITVFKYRYDDLSDGLWVNITHYNADETISMEGHRNRVAIPQENFDIQLLDRNGIATLALLREDSMNMLWRCGDTLVNGVKFEMQAMLHINEQSKLSMQERAADLYEALIVAMKRLPNESRESYELRVASALGWEENAAELLDIVERVRDQRARMAVADDEDDMPFDDAGPDGGISEADFTIVDDRPDSAFC